MANISKILSDVFFGTQQSRYAAIAIFLTIAILCFFILFTSSDIPIEQRLVVVFFILIATVPSILFSLFELTCIVTGGTKTSRWWCYWLAWFISILMIVYCVFIIISVFLSMASYDTAMTRLNETEAEDRITNVEANEYAKNIMQNYQDDVDELEKEHQAHAVQEAKPVEQAKPKVVQEVVQPVQPVQPNRNSQTQMNRNFPQSSMHDNFAPISSASDSSLYYPVSMPQDPSYLNSVNARANHTNQQSIPEPFTNKDNLQDFFEFK